MPGSNSAVNNLIFGLSIAGSAQVEADNANQRAMEAEGRAMRAELQSARKTTNSDLERRLADAIDEQDNARITALILKRQLAEKDALLLDWMHSNEAFKRLARQYGKKLGVTDDQRREDYQANIIDSAKEDPTYAQTKILASVKSVAATPKP